MSKGLCLGMVGGLGVGATIHYYTKLAQAHEAKGRTLDMVIAHAETPRVFGCVNAGDRDGLAEYLCGFLQRLRAAGAEVGVVPAVTPLYGWHQLTAASPLPLVSMVDAVAAELAARDARRVAVFGTRYVIESGFFGQLDGVEMVHPKPDEVDMIATIYAELLEHRKGSGEQHRRLTALAQTLQARDGVDAILLAGTDLSLVFDESNTDFAHVDCAAVHLAAIVRALIDDEGERA